MRADQKNQIFQVFAKVLQHKYQDRIVVDFENGDTLLVDLSSCGEPFETDCVAIYSLQHERRENGKYAGTDELDYGAYVTYDMALAYIYEQYEKHDCNGVIYADSF